MSGENGATYFSGATKGKCGLVNPTARKKGGLALIGSLSPRIEALLLLLSGLTAAASVRVCKARAAAKAMAPSRKKASTTGAEPRAGALQTAAGPSVSAKVSPIRGVPEAALAAAADSSASV